MRAKTKYVVRHRKPNSSLKVQATDFWYMSGALSNLKRLSTRYGHRMKGDDAKRVKRAISVLNDIMPQAVGLKLKTRQKDKD